LIFDIDIIRNNADNRYIIKTASLLNELFSKFDLKLSIYSSIENIINFKNEILEKKPKKNQKIDLFINLENKLVNFEFSNYSIKSFKDLDNLKDSKLLDYSLEIS